MVDDVNDYEIDEVTGRKSLKYDVILKSVGETWESPQFNQNGMRKLFIHNHGGEVLCGTFGRQALSILQPGHQHDYHNGTSVWLECRSLDAAGEARVYVHAEWN